MRIALSVLFLAAQLTANVAFAQTAAEREACQSDYEKFCKGWSRAEAASSSA